MTEGILLWELVNDCRLSNYSVIIIDEAHERGLNSDFLLGLLAMILNNRKDLRIIVMSATLETNKIV